MLPAGADLGTLMVLMGAIFSGLRPLFGRWLATDGVTAVLTALYSFVASTLLFLPGGLRELRQYRHYRMALIALGSGLFVGIGSVAYFAALERLPVAVVTLIFFTYPAMVIAAAALLRRRRPQPVALLSVLLVLAGCLLIIGPNLQGSPRAAADYAIAFLAPLSWAGLLLLLAGPLTPLSPWSRIGFIAGGSLLTLLAALLVWPPPGYLPRTAPGWAGALGLVLVSGVMQHILLTLGVPKAGPERAAIAGVFEVATALVVGWVIFLEPVTLRQGVGVFLVGTALILTRRLEVTVTE